MSTNQELQLASLALHGGRYEEAERRFEALTIGRTESFAWLGAGMAKACRLLEGDSSVPEVRKCFELARKSAKTSGDRRFIEERVGTWTASIVESMYDGLAALIEREAVGREGHDRRPCVWCFRCYRYEGVIIVRLCGFVRHLQPQH